MDSFIIPAPLLRGGALVFGIFVLGSAFFKKSQPNFLPKVVFGFAAIVMAFGMMRSAKFTERANAASRDIIGKEVIFEAEVVKEPDRRLDFAQYVAENKSLGRVLIKTGLYPEYFFGDILKIKGKIAKPKNSPDFDYTSYLAKDDIYLISQFPEISFVRFGGANFMAGLLKFKKSFTSKINSILPEPQASFLSALLVGAKKTLPEELTAALKRTGTSHIVAISGYNISIIAVVLMNFFGYIFFPRRFIFWIIGIIIILFTLIAGAEASVVRAAIMGGLLVFAKREGRLYGVTNAIVLAAATMLYFNPRLLRYDAGFELSFLAALGLIYLAPYFKKWFKKVPNFWSIRDSLTATVSAQIATFPVIFLVFGNFSSVAILANVLILPTIPIAMLFGFLGGLGGFISLKMGAVLILPAHFILSYQIWMVKTLALLPFASTL